MLRKGCDMLLGSESDILGGGCGTCWWKVGVTCWGSGKTRWVEGVVHV